MKARIPSGWLLFSTVLCFAQAGSSGGHGHGGDAILEEVRIDDAIYNNYRLLDFYQYKLRDPQDKVGKLAESFDKMTDLESQRLRRDLGKPIAELPVDADFQRRLLAVLGRYDALTARVLAAPFVMYRFVRKDHVEFIDDYKSIQDYHPMANDPFGDYNWRLQAGVHQVGKRILDRVEIANDVFNNMYYFDRVGLFFHEAVYSLLIKDLDHPFGQRPEWAREAIGKMFAPIVMGTMPESVFTPERFEFAKILQMAQPLLMPGERLKVEVVSGKTALDKRYRILARKFTIEFKFEPYKTKLFDDYYLMPSFMKNTKSD